MDQRVFVKVCSLCIFAAVFSVFSFMSEVSCSGVPPRRMNMTFQMNGSDAILTCNVKDLGKKRVIWKRLSDAVPIAVGTTRFAAGKKYKVKKVRKGPWQLVIKNVVPPDAGEYECRLTGQKDVADILSVIIPSVSRPYFLSTETTIKAQMGSDVVLPCEVNNLRKYMVMWIKEQEGGSKVLSLKKKIHSGDKRQRVMHTRRPEWSLRIEELRPEDLGVYRCVVNSQPPITRTLELLEGQPLEKRPEGGEEGGDKPPKIGPSKNEDKNPRLIEETFKDKVKVDQYQSVNLTCQFKGDPRPNITWERRIWTQLGEKIIQKLNTKGETHTLTNVQLQDAGVYVCRANNKVPPAAQGRIRVEVKEVITTTTPIPTTTIFDPVGEAAPRVYPMQEVVTERRGRDTEVGCRAVGFPLPIVHWFEGNGNRVEESYKFEVFNKQFRHHTVYSTLHIRSLHSGNFGKYRCYAFNKLGHAEATVVLAHRRQN